MGKQVSFSTRSVEEHLRIHAIHSCQARRTVSSANCHLESIDKPAGVFIYSLCLCFPGQNLGFVFLKLSLSRHAFLRWMPDWVVGFHSFPDDLWQ